MSEFELFLRSPNVGNPCLVHKATAGQDTVFKVIFSGITDRLDVKSLLETNLFLQPLADTRQILQNKAILGYDGFADRADIISRWSSNWDMDNWPLDVRNNLIPLKIEEVESPIESAWKSLTPIADSLKVMTKVLGTDTNGNPIIRWYPTQGYIDCNYAYWVKLRVESKYLTEADLPQLFNIIQKYPLNKICNVNYHSVYIHDKNWSDFSFIHATDSHIAWRNDFIKQLVQEAMGQKYAAFFINFNENFRDFIKYANQLHRQDECDFIVLTGDLVDYIHAPIFVDPNATIVRPFVGGWAIPRDNFEVFLDLVVSWPKCPGVVVDEELEVPLFTVLGNHDYRLYHYPLVSTFRANIIANKNYDYLKEDFKDFGLTLDEALSYEVGSANSMRFNTPEVGLDAQSHLDHAPESYRASINPDLDYVIPLGNHRIICLDSGADSSVFTSLWDIITYKIGLQSEDRSRDDLVNNTSHGWCFAESQIQFLEDQVKDIDGLVVIACHNPLFNFRLVPPPHIFRETEHLTLTPNDVRELKNLVEEEYLRAKIKDKDPGDSFSSFEDWFNESGWSLLNTSYFKKGQREPDLTNSAPDERFNEFMNVICNRTKNKKSVELILTGHTHRSAEFIAREANGSTTFFHDYYIDGTLNRQSPSKYWNTSLPDYTNPLTKTLNPKKWWKDHSPLFLQTISVTCPFNGDWPTWGVGFLRFIVKGDIITNIKRENHLQQNWSQQFLIKQAYLILNTSLP
ncbi:MAG: hypothetical protein QG670_2194 [Thermoproteota archaeon]|nr:hypothetical protein [Thermoproteota archaeon]